MLKVFKYISISLFFFTVLGIFSFFNLGNFLDVSQKPIKSDIIVCLGGGEKYRIETAVRLYNKNYSNKNLLILTGDNRSAKRKEKNMDDKRIEYIKENKLEYINIKMKRDTKNTKEEILFIKKYLLEKKYKSAMIISDAPHTRRIQTLINLLDIKGDEKLIFNLVNSENPWWNSNTYYTEKKASAFVLSEVFKLGYTYIAYGVFEPIGLLGIIEDNFIVEYFRKTISKQNYFYLKEK